VLRTRRALMLENLALRHQLAVLQFAGRVVDFNATEHPTAPWTAYVK
jgi:hypothetical protein